MKTPFFVATVFLFILGVAGCGGGGDDADALPPTITGTSPGNGAVDVDPVSSISISFSEAMNKNSVEAAFSATPALPAGAFTWAQNTITFTPGAPLDESTGYVITMGTGAKDAAGNALAAAYAFGWTTADQTGPTITSTAPRNGQMHVDLLPAISITFSEAMDQDSVEAAFSSTPALPPGDFAWAGNTMTFTPGAALDESTDYAITVDTGATDAAGNALVGDYSFAWKTMLPYKALTLQSDFGTPTSNGGVAPSSDGQYIYWWDGTVGEGSGCNIHLYKVKISDSSSQTIWTNRSVWGIYDDGDYTWIGNYYPYGAARISDADAAAPDFVSFGHHVIGLDGNKAEFPYAYFGTSTNGGILYWNKTNAAMAGSITGSAAYIYQSAVIGEKVYFPKGNTASAGVMVVDAVNDPTALQTTLLGGDARIANANEIFTDGTYLYVRAGTAPPFQIQKIDPAGTGSIVATFNPIAPFLNAAVIGDYIYSGIGTANNKEVYIMDKDTGSFVIKDCSAYLPTDVGTPRWDFYNDGIWYGPQNASLSDARRAYFIPRSIIDNLPDQPVAP